ncbi:MAG: hypothetical protein JWL85_549 [Candidatus Saccharibacteria bacterium]|nr:hypothetical protein [Candidatus Saccharibacteria bacterium]
MKNILKNMKIRLGAALTVSLMIAAVIMAPTAFAANVKFNSARDCDGNAMLYCGAMNIPELQTKHKSAKNIDQMYAYFGISDADIKALGSTAVAGKVGKDGKVTVNGKVVATNAISGGRQPIRGSSKVTHQGVTFYNSRTQTSFLSSNLDAYVVMKNGKFDFAILAACGNAVKATPVPTPTPKPKPQPKPEKPTEKPPVVPEVPVAQVLPAAKELPHTGPENLLGAFLGTSALGTVAHRVYLKRRASK